MEGRNQFTFYRSYADAIRHLCVEDQNLVLFAVIDYALDGTLPEDLPPTPNAFFCLIKPVLEAGRKKAAGGSKPKRSKKDIEKEKEKEGEKEVEVEIEDKCLMDEAGFESFWKSYPAKVGKARAREVWNAVRPDPDEVMAGLQRWKASKQWDRENGRFIPRASRWLEEKQYQDHPDPVKKVPMGATGVLGKAELDAIRRVMQE